MGYFQPLVIYRNPEDKKENSILRYIGNRVLSKNANFLCGVVGAVGSGKSYSCLKMAEEYSRMFGIEFNPEHHVISSLKELLLLITEPEATRKIKFGSVIVFDEPQIEGNAKNWQSDVNQALGQLISTFRNQRLVVFFALPFLEMFDKQSRILFHGEFKVEGYDRNTKITTIKPRFLEWNKKKGDFYRKMLVIHYKTPEKSVLNVTKLNRWHIGLASDETIKSYEAKKKKFTDDLNMKLLRNIEMQEKREAGTDKSAELFKIEELFDRYGDDYISIMKEVPHLTPFTVDKYIFFIKKSRKMIHTRPKR
jgi:hypothetical protein